ncbi:MAG TPA: RecX family transcriptional regulator [Caldimonas sp.]
MPRSLKSRALQLLAQRDQSRLELRRKLLRHARAEAAGDEDAAPEQVDALLDWLEANRFLSNERFVESRVHAREARFGNLRIKSELAQHALALPADLERALADSELERAAAVRARRFAQAPRDAAERAAQARFLLARGFSPELVHRLMRRLPRAADSGEGSTSEAG